MANDVYYVVNRINPTESQMFRCPSELALWMWGKHFDYYFFVKEDKGGRKLHEFKTADIKEFEKELNEL